MPESGLRVNSCDEKRSEKITTPRYRGYSQRMANHMRPLAPLFGAWLKQRIERMGITPDRFGRGMPPPWGPKSAQHVRDWINGKKPVTDDAIIGIARVTGETYLDVKGRWLQEVDPLVRLCGDGDSPLEPEVGIGLGHVASRILGADTTSDRLAMIEKIMQSLEEAES